MILTVLVLHALYDNKHSLRVYDFNIGLNFKKKRISQHFLDAYEHFQDDNNNNKYEEGKCVRIKRIYL